MNKKQEMVYQTIDRILELSNLTYEEARQVIFRNLNTHYRRINKQ